MTLTVLLILFVLIGSVSAAKDNTTTLSKDTSKEINQKISIGNGDTYEGEMINGKMNGMGKYIYNNGVIYEGNYNNGTKNGKGKLIYPDGRIFEGEFVDGFPRGKEHLMNDNYNFVEKNENNKNKNVEPLKIIQM